MPSYKQKPEDFLVEEIALYDPDGEGGHCLVYVEKTGLTTQQLVEELAARSACVARDVGYAGRKDRWAVTRQWLSLPGVEPEEALSWQGESWSVLDAAPHRQKLRLGHLRANRFRLQVRDVGESALQIGERLERAAAIGFPNRFGAQRFGRQGGNAEKARQLLAGRLNLRQRRKARFLISSLQSEAFNRVLECRRELVPPIPGEMPWQRLVEGDVAQIVRSGGCFKVKDPGADQSRLREGEIAVTGPIPGSKALRPGGSVGALERRICEEVGCLPLLDGEVPRLRIDGDRRALAVRPMEAGCVVQGDVVELAFNLPPGSYATVLLEELFGEELIDASRRFKGDPEQS
ncbi:MAG: tRNA pseudouridine(13) synthase TruD [Acidobacteriota bacterium]